MSKGPPSVEVHVQDDLVRVSIAEQSAAEGQGPMLWRGDNLRRMADPLLLPPSLTESSSRPPDVLIQSAR